LEVTLIVRLVAASVMVTRAPSTTASCGLVTVPTMLPVLMVVWAKGIDVITSTKAANKLSDQATRAAPSWWELKFSIVYLPLSLSSEISPDRALMHRFRSTSPVVRVVRVSIADSKQNSCG